MEDYTYSYQEQGRAKYCKSEDLGRKTKAAVLK